MQNNDLNTITADKLEHNSGTSNNQLPFVYNTCAYYVSTVNLQIVLSLCKLHVTVFLFTYIIWEKIYAPLDFCWGLVFLIRRDLCCTKCKFESSNNVVYRGKHHTTLDCREILRYLELDVLLTQTIY